VRVSDLKRREVARGTSLVDAWPTPPTEVNEGGAVPRPVELKSTSGTGSMTAGSKVLKMSAPHAFLVGERVIVAVGGEAGRGRRGTEGVGGLWPSLSYADYPTMLVDRKQAVGRFAWIRTTTAVYRWSGGAWNAFQPTDGYYAQQAIPKALVATITEVDGLAITLDKPAAAATKAATVNIDNLPIWDAAVALGGESVDLQLPMGSYAFSGAPSLIGKTGWSITGAGKDATTLFSSNGARGMNISLYECTRCFPRDFAVLGNARLNGFGLAWGPDDVPDALNYVTNFTFPQGNAYPRGIQIWRSSNCVARRLKVTDVFHGAISVSAGSNNWAVNCDAFVTEPIPQYIGWQMQHADTAGGGYHDCSVTSAKLTGGFQAFRSNGVTFRRCTSVNGVWASNSSGNFAFIEPNITVRAYSQWVPGFSERTPIISVNSNISPPDPSMQKGGTILRPKIIQQGYINAHKDLLETIVIGPNNPNVIVIGIPATSIIRDAN
jgi:hypothetical protein